VASASASGAHAPSAHATPDAPPASVAVKPSASVAAVVSSAPPAPPAPPLVSVPKGAILSCKSDEGETKRGKDCGSLASVDAVVLPRLKKLAHCSAAEGQAGKLSFLVIADFGTGRIGWDLGKSSTVGNLDGLKSCLQTDFHGVSLQSSAAHDMPKYNVAYTATFVAPPSAEPSAKPTAADDSAAKPADDKPGEAQPASGEATVAWEVALVRDVPKTGSVVARLPRGAKVKLGSVKEGWYAIKYGDDFKSDGWVYRGAIGR
jgi:hypothetical protein